MSDRNEDLARRDQMDVAVAQRRPGQRMVEAARLQARDEGLRKGRRIRKEKAALRRLLKRKEVDAQALIAGDLGRFEDLIVTWSVEQLLKACPGVGSNRCFAILDAFAAAPGTKVGKLVPERRRHLAKIYQQALDPGGLIRG